MQERIMEDFTLSAKKEKCGCACDGTAKSVLTPELKKFIGRLFKGAGKGAAALPMTGGEGR